MKIHVTEIKEDSYYVTTFQDSGVYEGFTISKEHMNSILNGEHVGSDLDYYSVIEAYRDKDYVRVVVESYSYSRRIASTETYILKEQLKEAVKDCEDRTDKGQKCK